MVASTAGSSHRYDSRSTCMTTSTACAIEMRSKPCRYTGKERDQESGLDYFGARYYASSMGRFMSPDWSAKVAPVPYAKLDDPQSLNLYAYVRNNPLSRADLDGHSDYLWQKTKNWFEGNGFKTDAQVKGLSVAQTAQSHNGSNDWAIERR
jgi:RHS repeat-associated protein